MMINLSVPETFSLFLPNLHALRLPILTLSFQVDSRASTVVLKSISLRLGLRYTLKEERYMRNKGEECTN